MLKRNNFNGGPAGVTLTTANTGQSGDDAFFGCYKIGANTILSFDDAPDRPTAEFVMQASTGAATGQAAVAWAAGGVTQLWARTYVYYTVLPNNFTSPSFFYCESSTGVRMFSAHINSSGLRQIIIDDSTGTNQVITSGGIRANNWFRIEARVQFSTTTGNADLRWYDDADSDIPTETISFTNRNLAAATCATVYFGYIDSDIDLEPMRVSGLELNDSGWPGPAPFRPGKGVPGIQPNPVAIHTDVW